MTHEEAMGIWDFINLAIWGAAFAVLACCIAGVRFPGNKQK